MWGSICDSEYPGIVDAALLFTPVSITTLIGTEDARFILNGISPIAKGDFKWRDALLVTVIVNSNVIFTTLQTHAMITISSENFFSPNTSIAVRLSSRVSISETKSDMKNNKIFKMEENAYDKQTATVFPYDSDERTTNGRDRGKTKTKINFL